MADAAISLDDLSEKLLSDKVTVRREGRVALRNLLDSGAFLKILDQETSRTKKEEPLDGSGWSGFLEFICRHVALELSKTGSSKRLDLSVTKLCRLYVAKSDTRQAVSLPLLRGVRMLTKHFIDVLTMEEDDVDQAWHSAFVAEYCTVLHTYILPVAEYVEQLHQKDLECLRNILFSFIEDSIVRGKMTDETSCCASALASVIKYSPIAYSLEINGRIAERFKEIFMQLKDFTQTSVCLVAALNAFLRREGINCQEHLVPLHTSVQLFWKEVDAWNGRSELKVQLVDYACLMVKIGAASKISGLLKRFLSILWHDLDDLGSEIDQRLFVGDFEYKCIDLTAAVIEGLILAEGNLCEGIVTVDLTGEERRKRAKHEHPLVRLKDKIKVGAINYYRLLCVLLRREYESIATCTLPDEYKESLLQELVKILQVVLEDTHARKKSEFQAVWMLRTLRHLALVFRTQALYWKEIWDGIVSILPSLGIESLLDEAFACLSTLSVCDLVQKEIPPQVWKMRTFIIPGTTVGGPSRTCSSFSAIVFAGQALKCGMCGAECTVRHSLAQWASIAVFSWLEDLQRPGTRARKLCTLDEIHGVAHALLAITHGVHWPVCLARRVLASSSKWWPREYSTSESFLSTTKHEVPGICLSVVPKENQMSKSDENTSLSYSSALVYDRSVELTQCLGEAMSVVISGSQYTPRPYTIVYGASILSSFAVLIAAVQVAQQRPVQLSSCLQTLLKKVNTTVAEGVLPRLSDLLQNSSESATFSHALSVFVRAGGVVAAEIRQTVDAVLPCSCNLMALADQIGNVLRSTSSGTHGGARALGAALGSDCELEFSIAEQSKNTHVTARDRCIICLTQIGLRGYTIQTIRLLYQLWQQAPNDTRRLAFVDAITKLPFFTERGIDNVLQGVDEPIKMMTDLATASYVSQAQQTMMLRIFVRALGQYKSSSDYDEVKYDMKDSIEQFLRSFRGGRWMKSQWREANASRDPLYRQLCPRNRSLLVSALVRLLQLDEAAFGGFTTSEDVQLNDILLDCLNDPSYEVRLASARELPRVFAVYPEVDHHGILHDILNSLHAHDAATVETTLMVLAASAVACPTQRGVALARLLYVAFRNPDAAPLGRELLQAVSQALSYSSRKAFLRHNLKAMCHHWMASKMSLSDILFCVETILSSRDLAMRALKEHAVFMVSELLILDPDDVKEQFRWICEACELRFTDDYEGKVHKEQLIAFWSLRRYHDSPPNESQLLSKMHVLSGESVALEATHDGTTANPDAFGISLLAVLDMTRSASVTEYPYCNPSGAVNAIRDALSRAKVCRLPETLVLRCLAHAQRRVEEARGRDQIFDALATVRVLCSWFKDDNRTLTRFTVFRWLVHSTLQSLQTKTPGVLAVAAGMLQELLQALLELKASPLSLQPAHDLDPDFLTGLLISSILKRIVSAVVEVLPVETCQLKAKSNTHELFKLLLNVAEESLRHVLRDMFFIPKVCQWLDEFLDLQSAAKSTMSLESQLSNFLLDLRTMSPCMRRHTAKSIREKASQSPLAPSPRCISLALALSKYGRQESDDGVTLLASDVLRKSGDFGLDGVDDVPIPEAVEEFIEKGMGEKQDSVLVVQILKHLSLLLIASETQVVEEVLRIAGSLFAEEKSIAMQAFNDLLKTETDGEHLVSMLSFELVYSTCNWRHPPVTDDEKNRLFCSDLWTTDTCSYGTWICQVVRALVCHTEDPVLILCRDLVKLDVGFAELVFPYALLLATVKGNSQYIANLSCHLRHQLESTAHDSTSSLRKTELVLNSGFRIMHLYYRRLLMSVGCEESLCRYPEDALIRARSWDTVYAFSIDYKIVARAAQVCQQPMTAWMYLEYGMENEDGLLHLPSPKYEGFSVNSLQLPPDEQMLFDLYQEFYEPDGLYALARCHLPRYQLAVCEHEARWGDALQLYDDHLCLQNDKEAKRGLLNSLQRLGCFHLLEQVGTGSFTREEDFVQASHKVAWSKRSPSYQHCNTTSNLNGRFPELWHGCARALQKRDRPTFDSLLNVAKRTVLTDSRIACIETRKKYREICCKLAMLDVAETCGEAQFSSQGSIPENLGDFERLIQGQWQGNITELQDDYACLQPLLTCYGRLVPVVLGDSSSSSGALHELLLATAKASRRFNDFVSARKALHQAYHILENSRQHPTDIFNPNLHEKKLWLQIEEAKLLWADGSRRMAMGFVDHLIEKATGSSLSSLLSLQGQWVAETRTQSSAMILSKYFERSVLESRPDGRPEEKCRIYYSLAQFLHKLYTSLHEQRESGESLAKQKMNDLTERQLKMKEKELKGRSRTGQQHKDLSRQVVMLRDYVSGDHCAKAKLEKDLAEYSKSAVSAYLKSLVFGSKYDLHGLFEFCGVWLQSPRHDELNEVVLQVGGEVPSFKFLPLFYQIASRMGDSVEASAFYKALKEIVLRVCVEHPHHSLYHLLSISNGGRLKQGKTKAVDQVKVSMARQMLDEIRAQSKYLSQLLAEMEKLIDAYVEMAHHVVDTNPARLQQKVKDCRNSFPMLRKARALRELPLVPIPTAPVPVQPSSDYQISTRDHFQSMCDSFQLVGGINQPKAISVLDSGGKKWKQLVKSGDDDLRQDAVMQQLFGLVNKLLQQNPRTRTRNLQVGTYKVIPFTPDAGLVEWVDNTTTLYQYLAPEKTGAHARFRPRDWSFKKCQEHMRRSDAIANTEDRLQDKLEHFLRICRKFRPVFHHFFLENYQQPAEWFERRLAFTRSMAASSIVGYIVGLGDRHASNILINKMTATVTHIDLGIAFEQGKRLKIPERVPFRLTRDLVDGMGCFGVEGPFRRCCEGVMQVLQENRSILLTVLEVFLHDPLYKWALTAKRADNDTDSRNQASSQEDVNSMHLNLDAGRVLLRIKDKLQGVEGGEQRGVEGQVAQLISDAQDPRNLSAMFVGWAMWL